MIQPQGVIYLCNVPWDKNYNHVSDGVNAATLIAAALLAFTSYTYSRKDKILKLGVSVDAVVGANYVVYKNVGFTTRYYYAFITKAEFASENSCWVTIETDVYQTWRDIITFGTCFVEREHVDDDTFGLHTLDEGLETGQYVANTAEGTAGFGTMDIIIATTIKLEDVPNLFGSYNTVGAMYYGVYSGCNFYGTQDPDKASLFIKAYNVMGKLDAIIAVFMAPHIMTEAAESTIDLLDLPETGSSINIATAARPTAINGYTPKNNKLLCFPYQYINVSNNGGSQGIFRWELFTHITDNKRFTVIGGVSPGATYKLLPRYQSNSINFNAFDEAITLSGFPVCCFAGSAFQTYLAQNVPGAALALAGTLAGAITGNVPVAMSGVTGVIAQLGGLAGKAMQPPQLAGNIGSGHANSSMSLNDFIIGGKSIKAEYAQIIDEYFTMFGYKVCRVKSPNFTGRTYFNYVKTVSCIIKGGLPVEDKAKLEAIFNSGVTIWHDPDNIGDYSLDNTL